MPVFIDLLYPGAVPDCVLPALFWKNCHTTWGYNLLPLWQVFCSLDNKKLTLLELVQFFTRASQQCWGMRWEESTQEQLNLASGHTSWNSKSQKAIIIIHILKFNVAWWCIFSIFSAVLKIYEFGNPGSNYLFIRSAGHLLPLTSHACFLLEQIWQEICSTLWDDSKLHFSNFVGCWKCFFLMAPVITALHTKVLRATT